MRVDHPCMQNWFGPRRHEEKWSKPEPEGEKYSRNIQRNIQENFKKIFKEIFEKIQGNNQT